MRAAGNCVAGTLLFAAILQAVVWFIERGLQGFWGLITLLLLCFPLFCFIAFPLQRTKSHPLPPHGWRKKLVDLWNANELAACSTAFLSVFVALGFLRIFLSPSEGIGGTALLAWLGLQNIFDEWKILGVLSTIVMGIVFLGFTSVELMNTKEARKRGLTPTIVPTSGASMIFVGLGIAFFIVSIGTFKITLLHFIFVILGSACYLWADRLRYKDLRDLVEEKEHCVRALEAPAREFIAKLNNIYSNEKKLSSKREDLKKLREKLREAEIMYFEVDWPVVSLLVLLFLFYLFCLWHPPIDVISIAPLYEAVDGGDRKVFIEKMVKIFAAGMLSALMIIFNIIYAFVQFRVYEEAEVAIGSTVQGSVGGGD